MKIKDGQSNEVSIKKEAGAVATINLEQFADEGFDNVDSNSLALPFLKVLGQLSPQVTQGDSQFNADARPGMIYNTVTNELYNGADGMDVIPCFYKLEYIEWKDRDKGAVAPVNVYPADSDIMSKTTRDEKGKDRLENGNYVEETASHYVMVVEEGKSYFWCTCGKSSKQPFCDGSHKGTEFTPLAYKAEESKKVFFCTCKQTDDQPLCDGSHNR